MEAVNPLEQENKMAYKDRMNSNDNYGETNRVLDDSNEARVKAAAQRTTGPTGGSPTRSSESEMNYNHQIAMQQGEKSAFRAHKISMNADPYNPNRIDNAKQQTLSNT